MVIPPAGGRDGGGRTAGGRDLRLPPPEHSQTVYCDQAQYGPVPGGGEETSAKGVQLLVGKLHSGYGGGADGGSGGGTDGEEGGDGQDRE